MHRFAAGVDLPSLAVCVRIPEERLQVEELEAEGQRWHGAP